MRLKMSLKNIKNLILVVFLGFLLTACATSSRKPGKDYYTGSDTVKFLASGVPDQFFSQLTDLAYTQVLKVH